MNNSYYSLKKLEFCISNFEFFSKSVGKSSKYASDSKSASKSGLDTAELPLQREIFDFLWTQGIGHIFGKLDERPPMATSKIQPISK